MEPRGGLAPVVMVGTGQEAGGGVRHGEEFDAFYAACYPRLVGQVAAVTGDLGDAEDAVQEAFVRASRHWARIREYDLPDAWVRRVAIREALSGIRRRRRRLAALMRLVPPPAAPELSADGVDLRRAMARLPSRQREVLVLFHVVELPVEEIAVQLRVPAGTVKSRLARGRAALARLLDEHHPIEAKETDRGRP
jgi:RNA polymerase sigma-70 factor (ECF subfamily)